MFALNKSYMIGKNKNTDIVQAILNYVPEKIEDLRRISACDAPDSHVNIKETQEVYAGKVWKELKAYLPNLLSGRPKRKAVLTVCGGSGTGKTGMAALLSEYFYRAGIGRRTVSGDNYPHRIPFYNDAERLRIYREGGLHGLILAEAYSKERAKKLSDYQARGMDADPALRNDEPWMDIYQSAGRRELKGYLGTEKELAFGEINDVIAAFLGGASDIWLRRMGKKEEDVWYEKADFTDTNILLLEWTHGNSDFIKGVDIPILLCGTPEETLSRRKERNRDAQVESPFVASVLQIEQELQQKNAYKAKIILSGEGELLTYEEYCKN